MKTHSTMNFLSLQEHKFLEQYPATKLLLENNTQPSEGKNLAHYLAALGQVELLQQFLGLYPHNAVRQCKAGMSPLMEAVSKGHIDVVLFLLDNREGLKINLAARNCRGQTVLHISVNKQHRHITSILLSQGVLVDALDAKGNSALLCAVGGGFEQDSWLLIERHANVNLSTKGKLFTPLILAASLMKFDLCKVLLTNGARINEVDAKGRSALDYVVRARFKNEKLKQFENVAICDKVIKLFCNNGVDAQSLEQHLGAHIWAKDVHYAKLADAIYKLDMLQLRSLCGEKTMLPNFHRLLHACSQKFPKGIVSFVAKADVLGRGTQLMLYKAINKVIDRELHKNFAELGRVVSRHKESDQPSEICMEILQQHPESFLKYMLDARKAEEVISLFHQNIEVAGRIFANLRERFNELDEGVQPFFDAFYRGSAIVGRVARHEDERPHRTPGCCERILTRCASWVKRIAIASLSEAERSR